MASDFYIVLPSNSSMDIHPNNTLAQYITNLPRRISLNGEWECGLTEIHYPHDWYNVRNARMVVEHEESVHNVFLDDGYQALTLSNLDHWPRGPVDLRSYWPEGQ